MRDTIDMARAVYGEHTEWTESQLERLKQFEALVRADEQEKYKWDIHSCGPTCKRYACVAMREAVEAEREACAKVCDELDAEYEAVCQMTSVMCGQAIRNRGNT
jgi:hypothetical protein